MPVEFTAMLKDLSRVLKKLRWMREQRIWPNGLRYLWTDAFGVVLLVSLYRELGERQYLDEAEWVVSEVNQVLGRPRVSELVRNQIGMASTSTTWLCGYTH